MTLSKIWVLAEASNGEVASITLEMLAKARELASTVEAVYAGADADAIAGQLGAHGATTVHATGDVSGSLLGGPVGKAIAAAIDGVDAIFIGTTQDGRDIAANLSVALDAPVITNVTDIVERDGALVGVEPIFGGTQDVYTKFTGGKTGIFLVRPKSFAAEETGGGAAAVASLAVADAAAAKVLNRHVEERTGPQLDDAAIVVAGGRGLGEQANFALIEDLAKALNGAPGASRAIVDAGWVPYSYQIGQTGKVVKPTVYIAAGISGATQHLVGMKGSKNIIAINKDPEAPIFSVADLGIVGDVHKVLPAVLEAIKNR